MTADPRPQPDAAQGEHSDCRCGHDWLDHTADENRQACMDLDCPCYNYAPGPPGAPASAPDAGDFEEAWRQQGGEREWEYERDGLIAGSWMKAGWKLATEAAQRQHAAEVAQRAVDHVEVLKQAGQTVVAATAALEAAQQEAARYREALETARHRLATLNGLVASDGYDAYHRAQAEGCDANGAWDCYVEETWRIDETAALAETDAALAAPQPPAGGGA